MYSRSINSRVWAAFLVGACLLACTAGTGRTQEASAREKNQAVLTAARASLEDGMYALAARQFRRYLKGKGLSSAERAAAVADLARALHEQGKHDEILRLFAPGGAGEGLPDSGAFTFWRAMALYEKKQYGETLDLLAGFGTRFTDSPHAGRALRLEAWCHLKTHEPEKGLASFERFDREYGKTPEGVDNLLEWAKALLSLNRHEAAAGILERLTALSMDLQAVREGLYWQGQLATEKKEWDRAIAAFSRLGASEKAHRDRRAEAWFAAADAYRAAGKKQEALDAAQKGMKQAVSPDLRRIGWLRSGRALLLAGRTDEGVAAIKEYISASPTDAHSGDLQLEIAQHLLDGKRAKEAITEFQHYLETFTNRVGQARAHYGKAWGLTELGRFAEAATSFTKSYELSSDPAMKEQSLFKTADSYLANEQYQLATGTYVRVMAEFSDTALTPRTLFQLGVAQVKLGDPASAEKQYTAVFKKYPGDPLAEEALLRIAELKASARRWREAIEAYNRVMTTYTNGTYYAEALHGRGLAHYRAYDFGNALADFERVLKDFGRHTVAEHAFYMRGMCYYGMWRDEEALTICREFLDKYPGSHWVAEVMFGIAKYDYNHGKHADAEEEFLALVKRHPKHPLADDALFWSGRAAMGAKEFVRANDRFKQLVKDFPDSLLMPDARLAQAAAAAALGKYAAAILIFDELIHNEKLDRDIVTLAWIRKGDAQFMLGAEEAKRYEESIKSYDVIAKDSNLHRDYVYESAYKIGRCLEKLEREDEALDQYYENVVVPFLLDRERGREQGEAAKDWFTRAAFNAVEILEKRGDWRRAVSILERVVQAHVPAAAEAQDRIRKIKSERPWLFFD